MASRPLPPGRHTLLRGRASECALLDDLARAIRRGQSRSLVLRGEAGIGKTALLDYLAVPASDLTVVRAVGVESEMDPGGFISGPPARRAAVRRTGKPQAESNRRCGSAQAILTADD